MVNTLREVNPFSNAENNNPVQLGLPLPKLAFKCSVMQQRYGVVVDRRALRTLN